VSEEEKEAQDKPIWEQKGYPSAEAMYEELMADNKGEKARADSLQEELGTANVPVFPTFNKDKYEADPEGYLETHQRELAKYQEAIKDGPKKASAATLKAEVNSVLARAGEKGYDKAVIHALMRSMVQADPTLGDKLQSQEGIRELGNLAMEKLKAQTAPPPVDDPLDDDLDDDLLDDDEAGQEDRNMPDRVPAEHRDRRGRSSQGARRSTPKQSEVDRLAEEVRESAMKRGPSADLVGLVIEQNLAHLGVEKPKKK
jgi:hypothetical protein